MKMKVEGFKDLDRSLKSLGDPKASKRISRLALRKAAKPVADDAAAKAPRSNPDRNDIVLQDNIKVSSRLTKRQKRIQKRHTDRSSVEVYVGVTEESNPYGYLQEFGTEHHAAQPFLRPAWDANTGRMVSTIKKEVWAGIKRQLKRQGKL